MAIKVSNTEVVSNTRELKNIAAVDDGTVSVLNIALSQVLSTDPTRGTLTKSFISGETASIALSSALSPAPVVSVTKEVPQTGIISKGAWDVASSGANYERLDSAYDTTLGIFTEGWDISTSVYSQSFSVFSQESASTGVFFKPDGLKMYIIGSSGDDVNEYNLSTAWDVSTSVYSQNFSVYAQATYPTGIFFKPDGLKMYIIGSTGDAVNEYNLSTAWDVSTSVYNQNFSVYAQESVSQAIFFKSDGSKMYILGSSGDDVNEYDLSTAWDVSTSVYNQNFSVSAQEATSQAIFFKSDGSKMYILGSNGDDVNEYDLSTAWDISTSVYSQNFSVSAQETSPSGVFFKPDGSKMYILGMSGRDVNEYDLDVTNTLILGTGSFASTDVGKTIEGNGGVAVLTAADGSYIETTAFTDSSTIAAGSWSMFDVAINANNGLEMSNVLLGAFDIANIPTNIVPESFDVSSYLSGYINSDNTLIFKPDGLKLFFMARNGSISRIFSFTLTTAFDASTIQSGSIAYFTSPSNAYGTALAVKSDGTRFYWFNPAYKRFYQVTLTTPWDLSTAGNPQDVDINDIFDYGLVVTSDGTKVYAVDGYQDIVSYDLTTAYDITTATNKVINTTVLASLPSNNLTLNADDTKLYFVDTGRYMREYTFGTKGDISTLTLTQSSPRFYYTLSNFSSPAILGLAFNSTGTRFAILNSSSIIYTFAVGTTVSATGYVPSITNSGGQIDTEYWTDINTMVTDDIAGAGEVYYAVSTDDRTTWSVINEADGVRPIVRDNAGTWEYNSNDNSTYWDISTASYSQDFSVDSQETNPSGLFFKPDGTKMFIVGTTGDDVNEYSLSTAWDVSTASSERVFSVSSQESSPTDVFFKPDGLKMYIVGVSGDDVNEYNLSTAWNISTASYIQNFSVSSQENSPTDVFFKPDGTKMFIVGTSGDDVNEYNLTTAWDISTASYSQSFSVAGQEYTPTGIFFKSDGSKMYIVGSSSDSVYEYSVGAPPVFTTSATWTSATTNSELYALQQALTDISFNRMDKAQLEAVTDPNHYTLGNSLDLMIGLYLGSSSSDVPNSDGVSIDYDATALNQGAILGTDYDYDFPDSTTVRVTSNATQNLKVRVV